MVRTACFILFSFFVSFTHAAGFISFGYGRGGTRLTEVTGGQDYSAQAGSGLSMVGGWLIPVSPTLPHKFEAQLGFGYLFQEDAGKDKNYVSWSRIPLEASYFYHNTREKFRIGWGATYHVASTLSGKGTNQSVSTSVGNTLGWMVTAEKILMVSTNEPMAIGIRYTSIQYRLVAFDRYVDATAWSMTFSGFVF